MDRPGAMLAVRAIGALFVLLSFAVMIWLGVLPLWRAKVSMGWVETKCEIQSNVATSENHSLIEYTYVAGSMRYTGNDIDFAFRGWSNRGGHVSDRTTANQYPVGAVVPCWYAADDPDAVVLERYMPSTWIAAFPLLFFAIGILLVRYGARRGGDDAPGIAHGSRLIYRRRGSALDAVLVIAMLAGALVFVVPAAPFTDTVGRLAIYALAALAVLLLLHELRCYLSVVTLDVPAQLGRTADGQAEWTVRSPFSSPHATGTLIGVATTAVVKQGMKYHHETTVETVVTAPIAPDGTLRLPDNAPVATPDRDLEWFVDVEVHLALGPDLTVRAPIKLID